jgi:hypothetical protein
MVDSGKRWLETFDPPITGSMKAVNRHGLR